MNPTTPRRAHRRAAFVAAATAALGALGLGGCVEQATEFRAEAAAAAPRLTPRPGVSPAGATVAFVSLEGAPPAVLSRLQASLSRAMSGREIVTTDAARAAYLVRGHLTSRPVEGATAVEWVWDVYDSRKQRRQRMEDRLNVRASADPWAAVDDKVLDSVAGRSADDLAAFLTNTPEAMAAAARAPAAAVAVPAARAAQATSPLGSALGYAPN